jgi:hypothetical protein
MSDNLRAAGQNLSLCDTPTHSEPMAKKTPKDINDTSKDQSDGREQEARLAAALGQIEKQFGKGSVMRMGDRVVEPVEAIPPAR